MSTYGNMTRWELQQERERQQYEQEREMRRRRRRRREILRRRRIRRRRRRMLIAAVAVILLIIIIRAAAAGPLVRQLTLEAGSTVPTAADFLKKKNSKKEVSFAADSPELTTAHVGETEVKIVIGGKKTKKSKLVVTDTTPPVLQASQTRIAAGVETLPEELLTGASDATDLTFAFESEPDFSSQSRKEVTVTATDEGGNTASAQVTVDVVKDMEAPVITGVSSLTSFVGEAVSYKGHVEVTDDLDKDPKLEVITDGVDLETPGIYSIVYRATDRSGNSSEQKATLTVEEMPEDYVQPEEVYGLADEVLDEIIQDGMSQKEKAKAIFDWIVYNVDYVDDYDGTNWTIGAKQGLVEHSGDCYVFFATAKALLTRAGIENIDVQKSDTSHSAHYWSLVNCGDGWYHFDSTPRYDGSTFFMWTDEQIKKYSEEHENSHIFDESLYPATPTEEFSMV